MTPETTHINHTDNMQEDVRNERFPNLKRVINHAVSATSSTALAVDDFLDRTPIPSPENFDRVKIQMDNIAGAELRRILVLAPHLIYSNAGEGLKDELATGLKVDTVIGIFGNGKVYKKSAEIPAYITEAVDSANDPIEGTDSALLREPDAVSIIAVGPRGTLLETPKGVKYMKKLFGPKELQGAIHVDIDTNDNLASACKELGIRPEDITVIGLDGPRRDRNFQTRDDVIAFGSNWYGIKRGDLLPGLKAATKGFKDGKLTLLMTIGGYEEGVINLAGATAFGGVGMGRAWHEDPDVSAANPGLIDASALGRRQDQFIVAYSSITGDTWMGVSPIEHLPGEKRVHSLVLANGQEHRFVQRV